MDKKKSNTSESSPSLQEMTRAQALAVSWTGLEALAKMGQLIICNDKTTGIVWLGIANASVQSVGKGYDLLDKLQSVGNVEAK